MRITALLVLLLLCVCTAASAQTSTVPTKEEFLVSLGTPEPMPAARPLAKQTCTVTLHCAVGGYFLSCTSSSGNCQSGPTWVKCDGVRQNCPVCYKTVTCGCDCDPIDCFGWSSCSSGARRVTCDGVTYACPPILQCCAL